MRVNALCFVSAAALFIVAYPLQPTAICLLCRYPRLGGRICYNVVAYRDIGDTVQVWLALAISCA